MKIYNYSTQQAEVEARLFERSQVADETARAVVQQILRNVQTGGDAALLAATEQYDHVKLAANELQITKAEIDAAYETVSPELLATIRNSAANIRVFHEKQLEKSWMDTEKSRMVGQLVRPLARVGLYVPGGRAAYPSSVLMNAIPARVAGVGELIMVTPPDKQGKVPALTLVAAREAGVDKIYRVGGAQAIAALAYGTATIPRVDKIVGPGNLYVALAKREVFGWVGVDMVAGPSEVLVIADSSARPAWVAADMLSQAEHDPLAAAILLTPDAQLAQAVSRELEIQVEKLDKKEIAAASLSGQGAIVVTPDIQTAISLANRVAPEHLELAVSDPFEWLSFVENAGAIFLGHYTPEPVGDYYAGPNHILPTSGTARFSSPLGVSDFQKRSSLIWYQQQALSEAAADIDAFAKAEGLDAHARAVTIRFE